MELSLLTTIKAESVSLGEFDTAGNPKGEYGFASWDGLPLGHDFNHRPRI